MERPGQGKLSSVADASDSLAEATDDGFPWLVSFAAIVLAFASPALAQRTSVSHKSAVVRQIAQNQACATDCQTKEAFITIPHAVGDMLKGGIGAREVHGTPIDAVPVFPRKASWIGSSENELAHEFDQHVQTNIVAYAAAMTSWQTQYGLATATHDLIQRVTHRAAEKRVIVNLITFDNGNYYYNGARVMPEDPNAQAQILYVRAIPSAVTSGLPASWNWTGAGTLSYEKRNSAFASGAGFTNVAVGNVYDEPFDYSGAPYDPDARLTCLVGKARSGCGQSQPDVKGLIDATNATYAVLDYHRRVKPSGVRFGSGWAPQLTARVTDRVATFACPTENNGTYSQVFRHTMRVENQVDRFLVFPDGRHYFIQTFKDVVSPAEVATPGTSAIARNGEYPNLGTRFLHHVTRVFTTSAAYAPNTVSLEAVTTNNLAAFCGCAPLPPYSETYDCQQLNSFWVGTWTRRFTYNATQCIWSSSDDTSTCVVDWCLNLPGNQPAVPPGMVRTGTTCSCTGGRSWDYGIGVCVCPSGQVWNGAWCEVPPPADVCDNIDGLQTSPPPETFQSGASCLCTGGRTWSNATMQCECPFGTAWNGATCAIVNDACEYIDSVRDVAIQSSVPGGYHRRPGTKQCFSGDRFGEPSSFWALSCIATGSGFSSPVSPGPADWGYDPSRLVLCNIGPTGGSGDYCLAYTRKEDAAGEYWAVTPKTEVVYWIPQVCLGGISTTYFPGFVP